MKTIYKVLLLFAIAGNGNLVAFKIDPFNPKASLTENFSTNCLQMTQSQQMLKAYIMVGLNSTFQNPKEKLAKAIVDYDRRAHQVRAYFHKLLGDDNRAAKAAFDEAMKLWQESKAMLEQKPTKENALKIRQNFLLMIHRLLQGTLPLATPDLELISLTGKLCRKPIEITNDYLMRVWDAPVPGYDEDVKQTIENFHKNLATLKANRLNNEKSLALLNRVEKQFLFFEIMYKSKTRFIPNLLSKKADDNFKLIRQVKQIYKQESEKLH